MKDVLGGLFGTERVNRSEAEKLVKEMFYHFSCINVPMTLKLHFLQRHLDEFMNQLLIGPDQDEEVFYKIVMATKIRDKNKRLDHWLAELCWWHHKMCLCDEPELTDPDDTGDGGHTERDVPLVAGYEGHSAEDLPLNPLCWDL